MYDKLTSLKKKLLTLLFLFFFVVLNEPQSAGVMSQRIEVLAPKAGNLSSIPGYI